MDPSVVPNMVETMALIDDTVGFTFVERSESQVCDGVTIPEVCVGLKLSVVKDTKEATVEVGPSIDRGGAVIRKVGLFGSKYGKGGGDDPCLLEQGSGKAICKIEKGKLVGRYSVRCSSSESLLSFAERDLVRRRFIGSSESLASGSMVKGDGLKCCKGVRLYDDSPEPTSGLSPRSLQDLHKDRISSTMNDSESD